MSSNSNLPFSTFDLNYVLISTCHRMILTYHILISISHIEVLTYHVSISIWHLEIWFLPCLDFNCHLVNLTFYVLTSIVIS